MKTTQGSILMEFVLILPIYFVLFGGVFWVGDLFLNRQKLYLLDRNAAYHAGIRHDRGSLSIWTNLGPQFFPQWDPVHNPMITVVKQTRALVSGDAAPWAMVVGGKVGARSPMAPWTSSWLRFDALFNSTAATSEYYKSLMFLLYSTFNQSGSSYNFLHASLMRTKGSERGIRAWHPRDVCDNNQWYSGVVSAKDPYMTASDIRSHLQALDNDDVAKAAPSNRRDYERFYLYWMWSQNPFDVIF